MTMRWLLSSLLLASAAALSGDVAGDDARAVALEAPSPVVLGDTIPVRAVFQNTGGSTWDLRYGCLATWRTDDPEAPRCAVQEHQQLEPLERGVLPGETLVVELELPTIAVGPHTIVVQLQDPEGAPFGSAAGPVQVEVTTEVPAAAVAFPPPPPWVPRCR